MFSNAEFRFAACFVDHRDPDLIEHTVEELVRQRVYGLALGYEDLNDHDDLRRDPLLAVAGGKVDPEGQERKRVQDTGCARAGKSTLNRLELTPEQVNPGNRYQKIVHHAEQIEDLFVTLFLEGHAEEPDEIVLDFDATDDPLHGHQEGRYFHGDYDEYCYLPLYLESTEFSAGKTARNGPKNHVFVIWLFYQTLVECSGASQNGQDPRKSPKNHSIAVQELGTLKFVRVLRGPSLGGAAADLGPGRQRWSDGDPDVAGGTHPGALAPPRASSRAPTPGLPGTSS